MKKIILSTMCILAIAQNIDSDLDGVFDINDKCPNTPFLQTVNQDGCSKIQLYKNKKPLNYTFNIGVEYDINKDYENSVLRFSSISYKKQNYYISYFFSQLNENYGDSYKNNDSILSFYYKYKLNQNNNLKIGLKYYLSTYYNDSNDYAIKFKDLFKYNNLDISLGLKYKIYGESNTTNKTTISFDIGKNLNKFYLSPYIYSENSKYDSGTWNTYTGIYTQYKINNKISASLDISTNISNNSVISIVTNIGYKF